MFIELTPLLSPGSFVLNVALSPFFLEKFITSYCRAHVCAMSVNLYFLFNHVEKDLLIHFAIISAIETGFRMIWSLVAMHFVEGDR